MAFSISKPDQTIEAIVSKDSALDCTPEDYDAYLENLDEAKLKFKAGDEPTRFVMRKTLPYEASQKVMNSQASIDKGKVTLNMSYVMEEVRLALVDIKNPSHLPGDQHIEFKRENDGYCSKALIAGLQAAGVLMDLFRARQAVLDAPRVDALVKKN
jgi:hypothetical protein